VGCICPVDRAGKLCDDVRRLRCEVEMVTPRRRCPADDDEAAELAGAAGYDAVLDGDPPCLWFGSRDVVKVEVAMRCGFYDPLQVVAPSNNSETQAAIDQALSGDGPMTPRGFEYWLAVNSSSWEPGNYNDAGAFALSSDPKMEFLLRPVNWDRMFSDFSLRQTVALDDPAYFTGARLIEFELDLSNIASNPSYSPMGRAYFELRPATSSFVVFDGANSVERVLIDFDDFVPKERVDNFWTAWKISMVSVVAVLALIAVLIIATYAMIRKRRSDDEKVRALMEGTMTFEELFSDNGAEQQPAEKKRGIFSGFSKKD